MALGPAVFHSRFCVVSLPASVNFGSGQTVLSLRKGGTFTPVGVNFGSGKCELRLR